MPLFVFSKYTFYMQYLIQITIQDGRTYTVSDTIYLKTLVCLINGNKFDMKTVWCGFR